MDSVPFADGRIVVLPYDCLVRIDLACNPVYGRIRLIFATKPRVLVLVTHDFFRKLTTA